jgi:hypothetical protein
LGNNKFASASGTLVASIQYLRRSQVSLSIGLVATVMSFIGSAIGSFLANLYADTYLNYLLVILVPAIALFMLFKPDFGQAKEKSRVLLYVLGSMTGLVVGAYDGFFAEMMFVNRSGRESSRSSHGYFSPS